MHDARGRCDASRGTGAAGEGADIAEGFDHREWGVYRCAGCERRAGLHELLRLVSSVGRVRDGTAANTHAAVRADAVRPLAETAMHFARRAGAS